MWYLATVTHGESSFKVYLRRLDERRTLQADFRCSWVTVWPREKLLAVLRPTSWVRVTDERVLAELRAAERRNGF